MTEECHERFQTSADKFYITPTNMDFKHRIEDDELISSKKDYSQSMRLVNQFLRDAKRDLTLALQNDRLSLLSRPLHGCITREMISPRYIIPSDYCLELRKVQDCGYSIHLCKRNEAGIFNPISLDRDDDDNIVDCLVNLKASLCCAAVAIDGERNIYQTRYTHIENNNKNDSAQVTIKFIQVDAQGNLMRTEKSQFGKCTILGINQNQRIVQLSQYIENSDESLLVTKPIRHLIGGGIPVPILKKLSSPYPDSVTTLNEEQQLVAHPLRIKTALEVAGPPGTGKTKTITELTRSLLDCSSYDILVLSERNGAIDAIGEKYSRNCWKEGSKKSISDFELWKSVLTFGSNGIGEYTKLFTLPEKVRYV
jgi:AAA domain